jgi:hypothetical protein
MKKWEQGDAEQSQKITRVLLGGEYYSVWATSPRKKSNESAPDRRTSRAVEDVITLYRRTTRVACCSLALLALAGTYPHISFHAKLRQLHFDTLTTMTEINLRAGQLPWYLQGAFRGQ